MEENGENTATTPPVSETTQENAGNSEQPEPIVAAAETAAAEPKRRGRPAGAKDKQPRKQKPRVVEVDITPPPQASAQPSEPTPAPAQPSEPSEPAQPPAQLLEPCAVSASRARASPRAPASGLAGTAWLTAAGPTTPRRSSGRRGLCTARAAAGAVPRHSFGVGRRLRLALSRPRPGALGLDLAPRDPRTPLEFCPLLPLLLQTRTD